MSYDSSKIAIVDKFCEQCGEPLVRRDREPPSRFAKRRFCGYLCSNSHTALARDQHGRSNPRWNGGSTRHPLYAIYHEMIARCHRPSHARYPDYGGRGIAVCDAWRNDFWQFVDDVGERPDGLTLDRIDNERGYEPGNVRWATRSEQSLNRRRHGHEGRDRNEKGQFA